MIPTVRTLEKYRQKAHALGLADKVDAAFAAAWSADGASFNPDHPLLREIRGLKPLSAEKLPRHSHAEQRNDHRPPTESSPRSTWPLRVRIIAKLRKPGDRGVGDTIERELGFVGNGWKWITAAIGAPCGCTDRQAWLNARFPY